MNARFETPFQKMVARLRTAPFDVEMQLKKEIADWFIQDGSDHLAIFSKSWDPQRIGPSYSSKLFSILRLSIECYLKGFVIVYSEEAESPEDAYKAARECNHGLARLLGTVESRSKWKKKVFNKSSAELIAQVDDMGIELRYGADFTAAFLKETFGEQMFESGPMSGTIGSDEWMSKVQRHAAYIGLKAHTAFRRRFDERPVPVDTVKFWERRKEFLSNVGFGCYGIVRNPQATQSEATPTPIPAEWKAPFSVIRLPTKSVEPPTPCGREVYRCDGCGESGCSIPGCSNQNFEGAPRKCARCGSTNSKKLKK